MLEPEIEPHARDARAFIIVCSARRAARNYSARGYGREPAPIPDTRRDDLNIPQHDATLFRRNRLAAGRGTQHARNWHLRRAYLVREGHYEYDCDAR